MEKTIVIKPMRFWQSLLFFLIPGLYAAFAQYVLFPSLARLVFSEENAYYTAHLTVFIGLLCATALALRMEGWPLRWASLKDRLRLERMDATAWKWTVLFLVLYLLMGFLVNTAAQFVYEQLGFWPPDADIPTTNVPYFLVLLILNILSEELWWRGYILPRQELEHAKGAWIVNGVLWSLFHMFHWWAVPSMLLTQWMIPFVTQRTRNTKPAIVLHLVSNGLSFLFSILPLLTG